ncbi:hypothetical protein D3C76_681590 [compost metagenome]
MRFHHRQVHRRKRHQRAKADQRGEGGQVDHQRQQRERRHQQDGEHRRAEAWRQIPECALWQHFVTPHGEQDARHRRLRGQRRTQAAGNERSREEVGQELPAGLEHHLVRRRIGIDEGAAREHQLADVGQYGEQHAGKQRGQDDRPWHVAAGVAAFFGQGRDSIETEERQAQYRSTGHQRAKTRLGAVTHQR